MFRFAVAAFLIAGCASVNSQPNGPRDLSGVSGGDLSGAGGGGGGGGSGGGPDLSTAPDLARAGDMAGLISSDLAMPAATDMATVYDLATSCTAAQHVLINEIKTGGSGSLSDEFIEIYNPCPLSVDLNGWKLVHRSAAGSSDDLIVTMNKPIPGSGYYLIASTVYTNSATPDQTYMNGHLAALGGGLAIEDPNAVIVDSMGYGNATNAFVRSAPAPAPSPDQSSARIPNGTNSNNNSADFKIAATPTPKAAN